MFFNRKRNQKSKKIQKRNEVKHDYDDFLEEKIGIQHIRKLPIHHEDIETKLKEIFIDSDDFMMRHFNLPSGQLVSIYYIMGMVNKDLIFASLIKPLLDGDAQHKTKGVVDIQQAIYSSNLGELKDWKELIHDCLNGKVICHINGLEPVSIGIDSKEKRTITEPETDYQVYGPKSGFIENSRTNISLVRNFIRDPRLKVKEFNVGSLSHTHLAVLYLEEYVDPDLLNQVLERIQSIDEDNLVNSAQLEHHLVDYPMSIFPQTKKTERPDNCAFALSQGKIIIIVDNSTFALILPTTIMELYETSEDQFYKVWTRAFQRLLRFVSLLIAATFPALYVSLVAFHPELIPTTLALTLAESRNQIPFPATVEAFMLMFALDVLVEASMRLPSVVGQTIGIVGAIVLGTAAVEAGIVSNVLVIVISFTAISAFTVPSWEMAQSWRLVRYLLLLFASFLGLYGLMLGVCLITIHLCHLHSFSKPYYSPMSPFNPREFLNIFVRVIPRKKRA